jgi:hypothetical protein
VAKRGIIEHPKTVELSTILNIPTCFAVGILECLWQWVARHRHTGDITDVKPSVLARAIQYTDEPDALWSALLETRWIDKLDDRVVVHDWHEHADNTTRESLVKSGKTFWNGTFARRAQPGRPRNSSETPPKHGPKLHQTPQPEPEPEPEPAPRKEIRVDRGAGGSRATRAPAPRRSRRKPAEVELTQERIAFAACEGLDEDRTRREWSKFADHEFKRGISDWDATWRTWVRNVIEWSGSRGPAGGAPRGGYRTAAEKSHDAATAILAEATVASANVDDEPFLEPLAAAAGGGR